MKLESASELGPSSEVSLEGKPPPSLTGGPLSLQGDQIVRFFAHCLTVHFGQLFENQRSSINFYSTYILFFTVKINLGKKCVGLHIGRFFHELIWSPCSSVLRLRYKKK
jgi:hypothetical protein